MSKSGHDIGSADRSNSRPLNYACESASRKASNNLVTWSIRIALLLLFAMQLIPAFVKDHPTPSRQFQSAVNLKQIGLAMQVYANAHNHELPDSLSALLANQALTPQSFVSPLSGDTPAAGPTTQAVLADFAKPGHCSYLYFGAGLSDSGDPTTVTACEGQSYRGAMNVLFLDGHVELVSNPAAQQLRAALGAAPVAWTSGGGTTRPAVWATTHPAIGP
jgi:prepilin-type processing-associated H-X9-DG protein